VSGDSDKDATATATESSRNNWTGWDPLLENQAGGKIYNSIFSLTNA